MENRSSLTAVSSAFVVALLASSISLEANSGMGKTFGAPTEGMSTEDYQSLVFLDPQNTVRMDWAAVEGMSGNFLIDNQGEPTVSVVDYEKGETIKKIDLGDVAGNRPNGVGARPGQRPQGDVSGELGHDFPSARKRAILADLRLGGKRLDPADA